MSQRKIEVGDKFYCKASKAIGFFNPLMKIGQMYEIKIVGVDGYVVLDNDNKAIWYSNLYFDHYFISIKKARKLKLQKLNNYENT